MMARVGSYAWPQTLNSHVQGVKLPKALRATASLDELLAHAEVLLMVVPTPFVAATMSSIKDKLTPQQVPHASQAHEWCRGHSAARDTFVESSILCKAFLEGLGCENLNWQLFNPMLIFLLVGILTALRFGLHTCFCAPKCGGTGPSVHALHACTKFNLRKHVNHGTRQLALRTSADTAGFGVLHQGHPQRQPGDGEPGFGARAASNLPRQAGFSERALLCSGGVPLSRSHSLSNAAKSESARHCVRKPPTLGSVCAFFWCCPSCGGGVSHGHEVSEL